MELVPCQREYLVTSLSQRRPHTRLTRIQHKDWVGVEVTLARTDTMPNMGKCMYRGDFKGSANILNSIPPRDRRYMTRVVLKYVLASQFGSANARVFSSNGYLRKRGRKQ